MCECETLSDKLCEGEWESVCVCLCACVCVCMCVCVYVCVCVYKRETETDSVIPKMRGARCTVVAALKRRDLEP